MITTYENKTLAYCVLIYGWKPDYRAYRIKNYKMRLTRDISTSSLNRIQNLLSNFPLQRGTTGENWYKTEWKK